MNRLTFFLVAGAAFALPLVVAGSAYASDASYCATLSHAYTKYVASNQDRLSQHVPADVGTAQSKCQSDPASAIPDARKGAHRRQGDPAAARPRARTPTPG